MNTIKLCAAWAIQTFSQSNDLFIPKDIIVLIVNLFKPKIRFIETRSSITISQTKQNRNDIDWPKNCNHTQLQNFLNTNGRMQIKTLCMHGYDWYLFSTLCKKLVLCEYATYDNLRIDTTNQKFTILHLDLKIKKIVRTDDVILLTESGTIYYFNWGLIERFGSDPVENFKFLSVVPVYNIEKIILQPCIIFLIDKYGQGFVGKMADEFPERFDQIMVSNLLDIKSVQGDGDNNADHIAIYLTTEGDVYVADNSELINPRKINLTNVLGIYLYSKEWIAVTIDSAIYVWDSWERGLRKPVSKNKLHVIDKNEY